MQTYFVKGSTVRVCGGPSEIHGFLLGELVRVVDARPEPELSHVALCEGSTGHQSILMIEEVEDL